MERKDGAMSMKEFEITDVRGYLESGRYEHWYHDWQNDRRSGLKTAFHPYGKYVHACISYTEWISKVLVPYWAAGIVTGYADGCIDLYIGRSTEVLDYASGLNDPAMFDEIAQKFGGKVTLR